MQGRIGFILTWGLVAAGCNQVDGTRGLLTPPALLPDAGPVFDAGPVAPDASIPDATTPPPPPDAGPPPPGLPHGAACTVADRCMGGTCFSPPAFPGGYCTQTRCRSDVECLTGDGWCIRATPGGEPFCAAKCEDAPCRPGYGCLEQPRGRSACVPQTEPMPADLEDGEPCTADLQCRGGTCFTAPEWPDGHCTTLFCERSRDCASHLGASNQCVPGLGIEDDEPWCARECTSIDDCRAEYVCLIVEEGAPGICLPDRAAVPPASAAERAALGAQCGLRSVDGRLDIPYSVAPSTRSYMITTYARDGRYVVPKAISGPGDPIDFETTNFFQTPTAGLHGFVAPVVVPAVPQLEGQRAAGAHQLSVETHSQDLCWYLLEEATPGTTIDLNIYLVGVFGISAQNAERHGDLQAVLTSLRNRFAPAGVSIDRVRYFDASAQDANRFGTLGSGDDFLELMATSQLPGPTREHVLSVNLFFVRTITFGALGVSSGLPGPAGLHGSPASGVVSSAEYLGLVGMGPNGELFDGNDITGTVLAHEIGHYLGLFHTSEGDGESHDPLADTPECRGRDFPENCPDLGNLMFPFADPANTGLTPGQIYMLQANPLTKD